MEKYGRPVAFIFRGKPAEDGGVSVYLTPVRMPQFDTLVEVNANMAQLARGEEVVWVTGTDARLGHGKE